MSYRPSQTSYRLPGRSHSLPRASALLSAIVLACLSLAACGGRQEENAAGAKSGNAAQPANAARPADGATKNDTASANEGGAKAQAGTQQVEMGDNVFRPAALTVPAGTKVTWVNKGHRAHTVVSDDKLFDSGLVDVEGVFSYTFDKPGTYPYHCAPHAKMVGQVVVR